VLYHIYHIETLDIHRNPLFGLDPQKFKQFQEWQTKAFSSIQNFSPFKMRFIECPSSIGYGNARSLAQLYGSIAESKRGLIEEFQGNDSLLTKKTIEQLISVDIEGFDVINMVQHAFTKGGLLKYNYNNKKDDYNIDFFGHSGFGGSMGFCDTTNQIGFGYATASLSTQQEDPRRLLLISAIYESLIEQNQSKL